MDKLKKQIGESFFNPVLYFLPLIVFVIGNNFFGLTTAWKISFPVALGMIFYVNIFYNRLFAWYVLLAASYIFIGMTYSLVLEYGSGAPFYYYTDDVLFIILMVLILSFRKSIRRLARKTLHPCMPMSNNFDELFRVTHTLLFVVLFFTILFLVLGFKYNELDHRYIVYLNYIYFAVMLLIVLYETVRVLFIRKRLIKESWVPIVTKQGDVVGSELYLDRFFSKRKYMHPVIRMHIIDNGKILLQKYEGNDSTRFHMWDTAINNHVLVGESIQQALVRVSKLMYDVEFSKVVFLSNYSYENSMEFEYVFLFVTCNQPEINTSKENNFTTKWWTPKQIKEEFESGIFTEEFKHEYKLLERGGLITSVYCVCDCELKEIFRKQNVTPSEMPTLLPQ